jgi:hypothetical protein
MPTAHTIPDTRGGRLYRRVLLIVGISAVVGIADQLRALFWFVLVGQSGNGDGVAAKAVIQLLGWVLLCWCAVRGVRENLVPPTWAVLTIPVLLWTYTLWPM